MFEIKSYLKWETWKIKQFQIFIYTFHNSTILISNPKLNLMTKKKLISSSENFFLLSWVSKVQYFGKYSNTK